jgi:hypothetical protein
MKVKIVNGSSWYKNKVGFILEVVEGYKDIPYQLSDNKGYFIDKKDCKIIEDNDLKTVNGDTKLSEIIEAVENGLLFSEKGSVEKGSIPWMIIRNLESEGYKIDKQPEHVSIYDFCEDEDMSVSVGKESGKYEVGLDIVDVDKDLGTGDTYEKAVYDLVEKIKGNSYDNLETGSVMFFPENLTV